MTIEAPLLEVHTKRTRAELWRVLLKWQLLRPIRVVVWVVGLTIGIYLTLQDNSFYRSVGLIGLLITLFYPLGLSLAFWLALAKDPIITAPTTMSIFPWGIVSKTSMRSVSLAWENFDSFVQTGSLVILRLRGTKQIVALPKRDLDSAQLNALLDILSQQFPAK